MITFSIALILLVVGYWIYGGYVNKLFALSMENDPRPIEDNTRGTVMTVDDIGTLHCDFDNGRSLGIVPGEDSFRRLTDEELAEEQDEDMDEDNAPVMGM